MLITIAKFEKTATTKTGKLYSRIQTSTGNWLMLDRDEKPYLAALMNDLKGDMSEAARERLAKGSKEFRQYVVGLALAKGQELRAKVRYENAVAWYECGRTLESTERAKMRMF